MALNNLVRAAIGSLPLIPRGDQLPEKTLTVDDIAIDRANVAAYAAVTGLRYDDTVPLTYPFVLTYPTVMELVTGFDFPFAAVGAVHMENRITRYRPIAVTDTVGVCAHAENLREHRKGLLVDVISRVSVGTDPAWDQVTTFLLTNTSNAPLDFGLALAQPVGGTAAHGGTDNFDVTAPTQPMPPSESAMRSPGGACWLRYAATRRPAKPVAPKTTMSHGRVSRVGTEATSTGAA